MKKINVEVGKCECSDVLFAPVYERCLGLVTARCMRCGSIISRYVGRLDFDQIRDNGWLRMKGVVVEPILLMK